MFNCNGRLVQHADGYTLGDPESGADFVHIPFAAIEWVLDCMAEGLTDGVLCIHFDQEDLEDGLFEVYPPNAPL